MKKNNLIITVFIVLLVVALISFYTWNQLKPKGISLPPSIVSKGWFQTSGPEGGLVTCFATIKKNIFAGTYGGVFVSSDFGESWNTAYNGLDDWHVNCLVANQIGQNTSLLLAGTNHGLYYSTNEGTSWDCSNLRTDFHL